MTRERRTENDTGLGGKIRHWLRSHPATYLVSTTAIVVLIMNFFRGETLGDFALQSLVLALFMGFALYLFDKECLGYLRLKDLKQVWPICISLLLIAFAVCVALWMHFQGEYGPFEGKAFEKFFLLAVLCVFTGYFEESLFRGVLFQALSIGLSGQENPALKAALVSAALFGLFHVSAGIPTADLSDGLVLAQALLKTTQAALFGFVMAALFFRTKNIWLLATIHALNNIFMALPQLLFTGNLSTNYLSGNSFEVAILGATILLYLPLAGLSIKHLKAVPMIEKP